LYKSQNNIGNIVTNALGLANLASGGSMGFNWEHLTFKYSGGVLGKVYGAPGTDATGAYAIFGRRILQTDEDLM